MPSTETRNGSYLLRARRCDEMLERWGAVSGLEPGSCLQAYLHYGYLPSAARAEQFFAEHFESLMNRRVFREAKATLVARGAEVFRHVLRAVASGYAGYHVVPLSGGLDSRALLAGLLEFVPADRIVTATFGIGGSWDYEIGRQVAKACGVRNVAVDLASDEWRWDRTATYDQILAGTSPVWLFEAYVNRSLPELLGTDKVYWSGFMGDPLAGSKLYKYESRDWAEAKAVFARKNRFTRQLRLHKPDFSPSAVLPNLPVCDPAILNFDEQLDFLVRQASLIRPLVVPFGYDYRLPFLHPEWIRFSLSVPRDLRRGQQLYKSMLLSAFPSAFGMPTKTYQGLPLGASPVRRAMRKGSVRLLDAITRGAFLRKREVNYVDFDEGIRKRDDLRNWLGLRIASLAERGILTWVDPESIWRRHLSGESPAGEEVLLLAALEAELAGKTMGEEA